MKKPNTRVVIVGGGFGGIKTALELANKPGFDVILLSQTVNFEYHGALYRSATGHSPMEVVIPIKDILRHAHNVTFVLDKAVSINEESKFVTSEVGNSYKYDRLVLAMGNVVNYFGIEGADQHLYGMNTVAQTIMLRNKLTELFRNPEKKSTVAIVGAGPSGVELAGEIQQYARRVARKYHEHVAHPQVVLIEGSDRILPMFDPVLSAKAYKRLHKLGVSTKLNTRVNSCEPGKVCLSGEDIEADVIVWTAGSCASDFYASNPKTFTMERGRVKVDEFMGAENAENIYVIGDNAHTPFSGMAQTALHDAKFVARNLIRERKGRKPVEYRAFHPTYVVPVGEKWAVLQNQKHQWSGRRAWLFRRRADLWVFKNFEPYKRALKTWRHGNRLANF